MYPIGSGTAAEMFSGPELVRNREDGAAPLLRSSRPASHHPVGLDRPRGTGHTGPCRVAQFEVRSAIRTVQPPLKPPKFVLVGVDDDGIVAVVYYTELSPEQIHIDLIAVAQRAQGKGVATKLGEFLQDEILSRFTQFERDRVIVTACVHPENAESRAFCEGSGLAITEVTATGHDVWSVEHYIL